LLQLLGVDLYFYRELFEIFTKFFKRSLEILVAVYMELSYIERHLIFKLLDLLTLFRKHYFKSLYLIMNHFFPNSRCILPKLPLINIMQIVNFFFFLFQILFCFRKLSFPSIFFLENFGVAMHLISYVFKESVKVFL
jgi:hypothetical protein